MSLRVAFVMPGVGVEERGAEAFVVDLCAALATEAGMEITLYCRRPLPEAPFAQRRIRALARDFPLLRGVHEGSRLARKVLDTLFLDPLNVEWATASLSAFPHLWSGRYDVVVMEGGLVGAWLCRILRRLRRLPFVDVAHGLSRKWEVAFARQRPDRVVTFTEAAARMIAAGAPQARIEVVPHGVDLDLFHPRGPTAVLELERPTVLVAGALDAHKRMHLAVEAMARLETGSLLLLGDGPEAERLDALGGRLLGQRRYRRHQVERRHMPSYYRAADLFTLPSKSESFGLVYLEAMACGRPCVAPDDAVRQQVIGDGGILCDVEDGAVYAATLRQALERDFGDAPRRRAETFPFATTAARYAGLLREVAAASRCTVE